MKKLTFLIVLFVSFYLASGQTQLDTALNFSVKDIYGNNIELFEILDEDKIVVIDFFSTTCGFCILYAPDFQASYEDFGENEGNVYFMKIAWGADNEAVAYFDSLYNATTPSVSGLEGGGNQVYNDYMVQATPTVIVITPDRVIQDQHVWEPTNQNINAAVIAAGGTLVGINDLSEENGITLNIYPNPSTGQVNIQFDLVQSAHIRFEVYDVNGNRVFENPEQAYVSGQNNLSVNLSNLSSGIYFIHQYRNGKQEQSRRIVLLD